MDLISILLAGIAGGTSVYVSGMVFPHVKERRQAYYDFVSAFENCTNLITVFGIDGDKKLFQYREEFDKAKCKIRLYSSINLDEFLLELWNNLPHPIPLDQSLFLVPAEIGVGKNIKLTRAQCTDNYQYFFSFNNYTKLVNLVKKEVNSWEFILNVG